MVFVYWQKYKKRSGFLKKKMNKAHTVVILCAEGSEGKRGVCFAMLRIGKQKAQKALAAFSA